MSKDPYRTLGLSSTSSQDEIRTTYRKLAQKYHPDVNQGDKKAENKFKEIAAAYDILSDPKKRKNYDEFGEASLKNGFDAAKARQYKNWQQQGGASSPYGRSHAPGGFGGQGFDLEDIFSRFGNQGAQGFSPRRGPSQGADLETKTKITFKDSILGTEISLKLSHGKNLKVKIPVGIEDKSTMRLKGQGQPGARGGPKGDLLVHINIQPHPLLTRQGLNIHLPVPVTLHEAYNGATIQVPTFDGLVKLAVPAGTQPGAKLRLKQKGIHTKKSTGDLIVEIKVVLPEKGHEVLAKVAEQLQSSYPEPIRKKLVL